MVNQFGFLLSKLGSPKGYRILLFFLISPTVYLVQLAVLLYPQSMGDESAKAIGLFWDIENCQVPHHVSALLVVQRLRERFFGGLREAEFMCVCDINKESKTIIEELNSGQVNYLICKIS